MTKKNRIVSLALILLVFASLFSALPASAASSLPELYVNSYTPSGGTISPSTSTAFTLLLAIDSSISATLNPAIKLKPDTGGSFTFADNSVVKTFTHTNGALSGVALYYNGSGKSFSFTLYYDKDNDGVYESEYQQTIYINNARTSSESSTPPIVHDPANYKPALTIGGDIPSFSAGMQSYLSFKLQNTTGHNAKDIKFTITTDTPVFIPASISGLFTAEDVPASSSKDVNLQLTPYGTLQSGYYTLNLNFTYKNTYNDTYTETIPITVHITGKPVSGPSVSKPKIDIAAVRQDRMTPGSDGRIRLTVDLKNSGGADTDNVMLTLSGFSGDTFTPAATTSTVNIDAFKSGAARSADFDLSVSPKLASGVYPLSLALSYPDGSGAVTTVNETVFISIVRISSTTDIRVAKTGLDRSTPGEDNLVNLTVWLSNSGKTAVSNIDVSLSGLSSSALSLYGMVGGKTVASLTPGGSSSVTFPLYAAPSLTTGNHNLIIKLSYTDSTGTVREEETETFVYISRPGTTSEGKTGTPRVIVSQYQTGTEIIRAGEPFDFTFTLKNTSSSTELRNIKINVSSTDGVFMPTAGTSSFYVESIPAGGTQTLSVKLAAKMDAESKSYPVIISVDYEDRSASPYSVSETISLPVNQPQRIEVSNLYYYGSGMMPSNINFQFINKGRSTLYNLNIHIEGPFTSQNGELFMGNFAPSSMDYFDDMITPTETGELLGKIVFSFEDANGNKTEYIEEFTASIFDEWPTDPGKEPFPEPGFEEPSSGLPMWLWIVIAAGGLLVIGGGITVLILVRKRKKRAEAEEDEQT